MRVVRAWLVGSVVLSACALWPSLDGLSGHPADASSEVSAGDGGSDAGGDGGRWCASQSPAPLFCDDFDDQGAFTRWTDQKVRNGATVTRDGTDFRSAPNALLSVVPPFSTSSAAALYLSTTSTKSTVHVAFDMRIDARDTNTGYAEINYITFGSPVTFSVYLRVFNAPQTSTSTITSEAYLADGGIPAHDVALSGAPTFDTWTRMGVDIDLASSPRTLTATIDGNVAALQTLESDLYVPGPVVANVGIGYTGNPTTSDWRIRYDNVTIDWQ